ncbi:transglycosylase SLT domain-containing protein [Halomonas marinisediminis]|uniref:Lytic murein transglycosylase n=1 Tax=Halomonas marinisediminis TaxID=2546095 RepID=A0ABY2D6B6_9GAMM|nr:transglycosylase SLT domain-containing protein [Halomonas marinisediminis]TDB02354.1 lytic murein transglycosylase [Halomonas marinisediminis]
MSLRLSVPWRALAAATLCCLPLLGQADDRSMREALQAARAGDWQRVDEAAIADHELAGYVTYHRLRDRLPDVAPRSVLDFIERHADSPLAEWMRGQAIDRYGRAGRHADLLQVAAGEPEGTARRCHYYTALLDRAPAMAAAGGRRLWRVGRSQPEACDTLFDTLRRRGEIGEEQIWERQMLAWQAGQSGLASYLRGLLGSRWHSAQQAMARVQADPDAITRIPDCLGPECRGSGPFFAAAMHDHVRADTAAALEAWRRIAPGLRIAAEHRQTIEHDLIFYSLVRDVRSNRAWVDTTLPQLVSPDLLELRIRTALADRDWRGVLDWIQRMPEATRGDERWQYWRARALEQLGDKAAAERAYAVAAEERSFYGFAAADRLGRPYALNMERNQIDAAYRDRVSRWPAVRRTEALLRINEPGLAASEWYAAVRRASPQDARALGDYARRRGWHAKLVQTTIVGQLWDALEWRFPEAYREDFLTWGRRTGVDPYLLMGIARRESAYNPEAVSPAGARGLMQVMPATATQLARQMGIADPGAYGVLDPQTNIRLGSTYIRDMLERYRGNRLAATAAYNAGPGRVDHWLQSSATEAFDLFVEGIPFRETRHYVQAVLTYRAIFESLANGGSSEGVSMLTPAEKRVRYDGSLLARQ